MVIKQFLLLGLEDLDGWYECDKHYGRPSDVYDSPVKKVDSAWDDKPLT